MTEPTELPVDAALPRVRRILDTNDVAIVEAPPGTGKTTRVPPSLLDAEWLGDQRVVMLEPRRVAARAAAERIAAGLDESVGGTVGLRTRFDTRIGRSTRLEVVTEGVLTRMLISDPSLDGIGAVIFDEFHERSLHADTALAFCRETRAALREDLRLAVMSATLDAERLATTIGGAEVVNVEAPLHPVETIYRVPTPGRRPEDDTADAVVAALDSYPGDVLVFLAGVADIDRTARALGRRLPADVKLAPLHGSLPPADQDRALQPAPAGHRKVVLSTPIAETSVTIDGVRVVVDSGRRRRPEIDVGRGMSRLRTVSASRAATDQRRGRAGRQAPGVCIRLWPEVEQERRRSDEPPEILTADLTSLALQIAAWGAVDAHEIPFVDQPPAPALAAARGVLTALGAIDDDRRLTEHGRQIADLGAEPRLAHMMLRGRQLDAGGTACDLAAVLADRDLLTGRDRPIDLRIRVEALDQGGPRVDEGRRRRARELARRWRRQLDLEDQAVDLDMLGPLVSMAFPDRIAQRRAEPGSFLLASGAGVATPPDDGLARDSYLAVAETTGMGGEARIVTAAPLDRGDVERFHADRVEDLVRGEWDRKARDVAFERQERLGALVLRREPDDDPDRDAVREALLAGVRREGLQLLGWSDADRRWRERLAFLHGVDPEVWPAVDDDSLLSDLERWLGPALANARRRADLEMVDPKAALNNLLDWRKTRDVDRLAPTHLAVPSGSRIPIDYSSDPPVLAVRLQELFGLDETPTVAAGAVTVVVHLLSPAHRPVQVTSDLAGFWRDSYQSVRKELRGRYPKHEWPEDPTSASPTNRAKRRR